MSKHTSGPWYVVRHPWSDSGCDVNSCPDPHGGELICATDEGMWHDHTPDDVERWRANACLIAAAPELLHAWEAVAEALNSTTGPAEGLRLLVKAHDMGLKAIAKAKGES